MLRSATRCWYKANLHLELKHVLPISRPIAVNERKREMFFSCSNGVELLVVIRDLGRIRRARRSHVLTTRAALTRVVNGAIYEVEAEISRSTSLAWKNILIMTIGQRGESKLLSLMTSSHVRIMTSW